MIPLPGVPMVIPVTDERLLDPEPESWLMYRRTYDGWGFSPLSQIDNSNVADLAPAWTFTTGANDGVPQSPPIVNGRMMFVTTAEQVIALDAQTGNLVWRYRHPLPADVRRPHATNRGVALYGDRVYVGTLDARVVALEAATGRVVWKRVIANYRRTYYITMAPLAVNGMVMVGTSGGEHGVRGFVVALDAGSGDEVWRRYTVPAPGEPGAETWSGDSWQTGGARSLERVLGLGRSQRAPARGHRTRRADDSRPRAPRTKRLPVAAGSERWRHAVPGSAAVRASERVHERGSRYGRAGVDLRDADPRRFRAGDRRRPGFSCRQRRGPARLRRPGGRAAVALRRAGVPGAVGGVVVCGRPRIQTAPSSSSSRGSTLRRSSS
ncbi:MAG: PQQ-binding-like beta-propeller repeat protein [Acidobacteria bacterium]|nr:PQQ-binding-like beta-propeller repeat protein [Acidobacteriota bacterium]